MNLLFASLAALIAGPILLKLLRRAEWAVQAVDAFVAITIGGLVIFDILPHCISTVGWYALPAAFIGLVGPALLHRPLNHCQHDEAPFWLSLAALAIALHALLDGVALVTPELSQHADDAHAHHLAYAVVAHRTLEGAGLWWLVQPRYGTRWAMAVVGLIGISTVMGYMIGQQAIALAPSATLSIVQAIVAGSLLHVVLAKIRHNH